MLKEHQNKKHRKIYSGVLLFFMLIGLMAAVQLVYKRMDIEKQQNHIENIVNYDAIVRLAKFEKDSQESIMQELKDAGVTSMAIYDRTLKKMADKGEVLVLRGGNTDNVLFYDVDRESIPGKTYVFAVKGQEDYFKEALEALEQRLGKDNIRLRQSNKGLAIELDPPYEQIIDMNLAISRLQAKEVIDQGFNLILRPTNFANETREDIKFELDRVEGLPNITGVVFVGKEVLGYKNDIDYVVKRLNSMHIPIIGIEATTQLKYEPQAGFYEMARLEKYQVGRLYTIPDDYLKKLHPSRVAQMYFISDIERNVRYNLFNIYQRGYDNQTSLKTSISYMKEVKSKLENRGFVLDRASVYPEYKPNFIALAAVLLGAIAMFSYVVQLLLPIGRYKQVLLFAAVSFVSLLAYVLYNGVLVRQIWALSSGILAPVAALVTVMDLQRRNETNITKNNFVAIIKTILYVILAALLASVGGLYIGALLGSNDFFMEFNLYRGVKLTFLMPILIAIIAYLERYPVFNNERFNSWDKIEKGIKDLLGMNVKMATLLALGFIAIAGWIFIGRSGHSAGVPVLGLELKLRHFLENVMYARPRGKEFVIGYPALVISCFAYLKKWPLKFHFLCTVVGIIAIGSMVETFAHIRTPILMSIVRGIDGCWIGIIVGLIALLGISILKQLLDKYLEGGK